MKNEDICYVKMIRGYPWMQRKDIAKEFGICQSTVTNRLNEMEEFVGKGKRYSPAALIKDGGVVLINTLAFVDFMANRKMLLEENARNRVDPFQPEELAKYSGWHNRIITVEEGV